MSSRRWVIEGPPVSHLPVPPSLTLRVPARKGLLAGDDPSKSSMIAKTKREKAAMTLAMSPGKSIFMTAFMLWMSGRQLNIFTISTTSMALLNPVKSLLSTNQAFAKFQHDDVDLTQQKAVWVAANLAALAVGLYKMSTMGLLPMTAADWIHTVDLGQVQEEALFAA